MDAAQQQILLDKLLSKPKETESVEFKENNADPQQIGEYISALSNAAALHGERVGYIIWGINDDSRQIVGTESHETQSQADRGVARVGQKPTLGLPYLSPFVPHKGRRHHCKRGPPTELWSASEANHNGDRTRLHVLLRESAPKIACLHRFTERSLETKGLIPQHR